LDRQEPPGRVFLDNCNNLNITNSNLIFSSKSFGLEKIKEIVILQDSTTNLSDILKIISNKNGEKN
jgi:hypothetical protein